MNEIKHTPEPWLRDDRSGLECDVRAASGRKVALCWGLASNNARNYDKKYKAECDANARRIVACVNACRGIDDELLADDCIRKTREDRDELLKQRDELLEALKAARRAIGDHHAPEDCYATGPMTGNDYLDLVQCPACFAISKYDDAVSNSTGAPK